LPEGDTIWRTAAALRQRVGGKVVTNARPPSIARLKGRRLESVEPNGKHLVMQFEGGLALHSHMRMTGAWHLYRVGERWRLPERRATAVLSFDDVVAVCFAAPVMELIRDAREPVAHLGPDILVDPFDLEGHPPRSPLGRAHPWGSYSWSSASAPASATSINANRFGGFAWIRGCSPPNWMMSGFASSIKRPGT